MNVPVFLLGLLTIPQGPGHPAGEGIQLATEHYELDVRLDYEAGLIHGRARLTLANRSERPAATVPLTLYRLMEVTSVRDAGGQPLSFDQDVVRFADFDQLQVTAVTVHLRDALLPGRSASIEVEWFGRLLGYAEAEAYVKDRIDPAFTILRDDGRAFPTLGVPSVSVNRTAPAESYDYVARITVPDSLFVANGGALVATQRFDGLATYQYRSLRPSWRMDFAIGPYGLLEALPLRVLYLREDSAGAARLMRAAKACMELFRSSFGPLADTPALTLLEIPDGWGSQADVTTIIQTAAAFRDTTRFHDIYHELAHLWQPDDTEKPSPRWNEGLSSFLEFLAVERLDGREVVDRRGDQLVAWLKEVAATHPRWRDVPMADYGKEGLTDLSYSVGAIFFDLLYRLVGPDAFNRSLAEYYRRFRVPGGSTADLQAAFEAQSTFDVLPLFRDWMFTTAWYALVSRASGIRDLAAHYGTADPAAARDSP